MKVRYSDGEMLIASALVASFFTGLLTKSAVGFILPFFMVGIFSIVVFAIYAIRWQIKRRIK